MCDKPIVGMVIKGPKTISTCRMLVGATNPLEAAPGTIRGDYGYEILPVLALAITVPSKITIL